VTVEGAVDEADFVQRLYQAVAKHQPSLAEKLFAKASGSPLGALVKRIKKVGGFGLSVELNDEAKNNWLESITALGGLLADLESPWILAVDELPLFILKLLRADSTGERAATFLHNLRELRQNQRELRWLLAGSIGLDTVTGRYNLTDAINDLRLTSLGPFSNQSADSFLVDLAESYNINLHESVRSHILDRLKWLLPYYIQLIFSEIVEHVENSGERSPEINNVDAIFEALLQPANKNYFDYWRQRLKEELGSPDDLFAATLLSVTSLDIEGASNATLRDALGQHIQDPDERDQRLRYLLDILINDGYLVESGDRHQFRFPLLREYWKRRVAK
jgi:hypothetical protein